MSDWDSLKNNHSSGMLGCLHTKLGVNVAPQVENKILQTNEKKQKTPDMESEESKLTVSNVSSGASSGRSKVALKPGHSLMDWIRFTHSGQDLTSTGGKCLDVSSRELAKHNTPNDAWIALKGKVYNITPYLDYHPGGEDELMRGAGKDATDLFNQIHRWVNAESMLQKCFVGNLKKSWSLDVPKFPSIKPLKKPKSPKIISENSNQKPLATEKKIPALCEKSEWRIVSSADSSAGEISLSLRNDENRRLLKVTSLNIRPQELITDLVKENLFVKINRDLHWLNIKVSDVTTSIYEVKMTKTESDDDTLEISLSAEESSNSSKADVAWLLCDRGDESIFWSCKLVKKIPVNYNTHLFTFLLPSNVKMWIPIGCHVFVKSDIEGMEIVRSYTPVISSLDIDEHNSDLSDGNHIVLMIKIYPSGSLTPLINMCSIGESIFISNYAGSFLEDVLQRSDSIIMLAAGTGVTPMIKIISWVLTAKDKKRPVLLLFFNKTEEDILWRTEFENCSKKWENFQVIHILSESDCKWTGLTGSVSEDILNKTLPTKPSHKQQILICGPLQFTSSALTLFETLHYSPEYIHAFTN